MDLLRAVVRLVWMWHDSQMAAAAKEAQTNHEHHRETIHDRTYFIDRLIHQREQKATKEKEKENYVRD